MKTLPCVRLMLACGIIAIPAVVAARAEDAAAIAKAERQKRLDQQFQESLSWYEVFARPDDPTPVKPLSILRWSNAPRGQEGEPTLIMWTDAGRPIAISSVYPWNGHLVYDCVSLARGVGLTASENGRRIWSPTTPGVKFEPIPDSPAPGANPAARLTQMKEMADRFKVTMLGLKADLSDREEMRLLPKPIYRYRLENAERTHPDLIDGALFAFVQGTDPEAVLLIEAVRDGGRTVWQYAFGRATASGLEARLGKTLVWTAPRTYGNSDPRLPAIVFGRPLVR